MTNLATATHKYEFRHVKVSEMTRDITVNPRNPSDSWARQQIIGYDPGILGLFVLSERSLEGGGTELVLLDGSNRANLMSLVGDTDREVICQVFTGLTHQEEAKIAREYNDRQAWKGLRVFLAECEAGDPLAGEIRDTLVKHGWTFNTTSGKGSRNGLIQGVVPFYKLVRTAGEFAAREVNATKGTERWNAAMETGRRDAIRVLDEAAQVYAAAFPDLPSPYAPYLMYGMSLVMLVHGSHVRLDRLVQQLTDHSNGQRTFLNDARSMTGPLKVKLPDAVAHLTIRLYNKNLSSTARTRIPEPWVAISR